MHYNLISNFFSFSSIAGMAADSWQAFVDRFMVLREADMQEKDCIREKILKLIDIYYDALDAVKTGKKVSFLSTSHFPQWLFLSFELWLLGCFRRRSELYDRPWVSSSSVQWVNQSITANWNERLRSVWAEGVLPYVLPKENSNISLLILSCNSSNFYPLILWKKVKIPPGLRADKYPHYMERGESSEFQSTSILGQIYDTVVEFQSFRIGMNSSLMLQ